MWCKAAALALLLGIYLPCSQVYAFTVTPNTGVRRLTGTSAHLPPHTPCTTTTTTTTTVTTTSLSAYRNVSMRRKSARTEDGFRTFMSTDSDDGIASKSKVGKPLKVIIAGAPASGKGTQCELIKKKFGVVHLSTGDILRAAVKEGTDLGKTAKDYMDSGKLVPDDVITGVVTDRLKQSDCKKQGWLLDGFPRTQSQAAALEQAGAVPDSFILLDVPDDVLVHRVVGRRTDPITGKIYHMTDFPPENKEVAARVVQRSDDTEEKIRVRLDAFKAHCDSVVGCYQDKLLKVDGTQTVDKTFGEISAALNKKVEDEVAQVMKADAAKAKPKRTAAVTTTSSSSMSLSSILKQARTATRSISSLAVFIAADVFLRRTFLRWNVTFPSSLAGMVALFTMLVFLDIKAPNVSDKAYSILQPGSQMLTRWLPVFFVPSLIVLPLAPALSMIDTAKLSVVIITGYSATLLSTANLVQRAGNGKFTSDEAVMNTLATSSSSSSSSVAPVPAFSRALQLSFASLAAVSGSAAAVAARTGSTAAVPLRSLSLLSTTLLGYTAGVTMVPAKVKAIIHPLITCTAVTLSAMGLLAAGSGPSVTWSDILKGYITTSICPAHMGAGNILLGFLSPSILSFALQMFQRRKLMFENLSNVLGATIYAAVTGLFGTAVVARLIGLNTSLRLSVLSRQITSPLAIAIAGMLGADVSMAVALVVVTGVIGANFGANLLSRFKIKDPVARGLAQGASAHGLGTAAMTNEPSAFAFSAISMALTATFSTILVSIPPVRKALLALALGSAGVVSPI